MTVAGILAYTEPMYAAAMYAAAPASETVDVAGRFYDFDDVVRHMDAELYYEACDWAGFGASGQAIVDEYCRLHAARHGAPFVLP